MKILDDEQDNFPHECYDEKCEKDENGNELFCTKTLKPECMKAKDKSAYDHLPETRCRQVERTVCGPESCPVVEKEKECRTEPKWVTVSIPEEECTMQPETVCEVRLKPVPKLVTEERCEEFPKEICHTLNVPKKIKRPVVKEWCYKRRKLFYFSR